MIHLAEGDPTAALDTLQMVLDGEAPVLHDFSLVESHLLAARAYLEVTRSACGERFSRTSASAR